MENKDFEVLTQEESKELDKKLKAVEDIQLPESLSTESIGEKLQSIPSAQKAEQSKRRKRKANIKVLRRIVASAAVLAIVIGILAIQPWNKIPPVVKESDTGKTPQAVEDYSEIENMFLDFSKNHKNRFSYVNNYGAFTGVLEESVVGDSAMDINTSVQSQNMSQNSSANIKGHGVTNEQVQGVSEADIIKNDGRYLYVVNPSNLKWNTANYHYLYGGTITGTTQPSALEEGTTQAQEEKPVAEYDFSISVIEPAADGSLDRVYRLEIEKPKEHNIEYATIQEMYVSGDRLIVIADCSVLEHVQSENGAEQEFKAYSYNRLSQSMTMLAVFDIADRQNPQELYRVYQKGGYVSSRLIGDEFVLLSDYNVDLNATEEELKNSCVPEVAVGAGELQRISTNDICIMDEIYDSSYLVASVMDINDKESVKTQAVLGGGDNVYCTAETLYVTNNKYATDYAQEVFDASSSGEKTQIYKFDIRGFDIKYVKSCTIDGRALNQFSIDEYNGMLRIATTSGNWGENLVNQLYILDENLETKGLLKNIAIGEEIKSVRFTGETAYVVTFEVTDPLFVIDLSAPEAPVIKGELKIPGYSAYLHPVGESLLLGVGPDGDESGINNGMKVSLFDVSDPQKPVECSKYVVNADDTNYSWSYISSDAFYDHKALCWDSKNSIMYIPCSKQGQNWVSNGYSETYSSYNIEGAIAIKVENKELSLVKEYSQSYNEDIYYNHVSRVTYIDNVVFTYAYESSQLISYNKTTGEMLDSTEF